jgi:hypothetical protein
VANRKEADVKSIGDLVLVLDDGFHLLLRGILHVFSLRRSLILVCRLYDQDMQCHFCDK